MKTRTLSTLVATTLLASVAIAADAPKRDNIEAGITAQGLALGQVRPMTVEIAKRIVAAAKKASCAPPNGACSGAFAVVDDTGLLVNMETIDGVLAGGPELAIRKAKTSAIWRRPTQVFLDAVDKKTNISYADGTFPDMTTSPGGYPIFKDGRVVGGFGTAAVGSFDATHQIDAAVRAEAEKIFGKQP